MKPCGRRMKRNKVTEEQLKKALDLFIKALRTAIKKKGDSAFASQHEALGVITEEQWELVQAVQRNNPDYELEELLDVGVSVIWEIASMYSRYEAEEKD
jgi:hypothetical protein